MLLKGRASSMRRQVCTAPSRFHRSLAFCRAARSAANPSDLPCSARRRADGRGRADALSTSRRLARQGDPALTRRSGAREGCRRRGAPRGSGPMPRVAIDAIAAFAGHVAAVRFEDLPSDAVGAAKAAILDTLAVGVGGSAELRACEIAELSTRWGSGAEARVW